MSWSKRVANRPHVVNPGEFLHPVGGTILELLFHTEYISWHVLWWTVSHDSWVCNLDYIDHLRNHGHGSKNLLSLGAPHSIVNGQRFKNAVATLSWVRVVLTPQLHMACSSLSHDHSAMTFSWKVTSPIIIYPLVITQHGITWLAGNSPVNMEVFSMCVNGNINYKWKAYPGLPSGYLT